MKRKRVWVLAALLLCVVFACAKWLANKRPLLVGSGLDISEMTVSPDGERIVVPDKWGMKSQIIRLVDSSRISIPISTSASYFFSPDGTKLYQRNFYLDFDEQGESFHHTLVLYDAASGRVEGRFQFKRGVNLYGAAWRDGEVVAESARQTWHLAPSTLQLTSTQPRQSPHHSASLCPDGQTLYWRGDWLNGQARMGVNADTWSFADLNSGEILWNDPQRLGPLGFSTDGRTVLFFDSRGESKIIARDTRTGAEKWRLRGPQSPIIALSPDQSAIYEARSNGELWEWPR